MIIPFQELSEDVLSGIIHEFVLREGTEYGARDITTETKVAQVRKQLERNLAVVVFDPETESCDIRPIGEAKVSSHPSVDNSDSGE